MRRLRLRRGAQARQVVARAGHRKHQRLARLEAVDASQDVDAVGAKHSNRQHVQLVQHAQLQEGRAAHQRPQRQRHHHACAASVGDEQRSGRQRRHDELDAPRHVQHVIHEAKQQRGGDAAQAGVRGCEGSTGERSLCKVRPQRLRQNRSGHERRAGRQAHSLGDLKRRGGVSARLFLLGSIGSRLDFAGGRAALVQVHAEQPAAQRGGAHGRHQAQRGEKGERRQRYRDLLHVPRNMTRRVSATDTRRGSRAPRTAMRRWMPALVTRSASARKMGVGRRRSVDAATQRRGSAGAAATAGARRPPAARGDAGEASAAAAASGEATLRVRGGIVLFRRKRTCGR